MVVYNLTKVSMGENRVQNPLNVVVWAMDEGGRLPRLVTVNVEGRFYKMGRVSSEPSDSPDDHGEPFELRQEKLPKSKSVSIAEAVPLMPLELGGPLGLDPRFFYKLSLNFGPGSHRVRIVCFDQYDRQHWSHGFTIVGTEPIGDDTADAEAADPPKAAEETSLPTRLKQMAIRFTTSMAVWILTRKRFADRWVIFRLVNPERLGHLVANTDIHLAERELGLHPYRDSKLVLFVSKYSFVEDFGKLDISKRIANPALLELWRKRFPVLKGDLVSEEFVDRVCQLYPRLSYAVRPHGHRDIHGSLDRTPPSITIPSRMKEEGAQFMENLGIPPEANLVLFHHRTSEYVNETYKSIPTLESVRYGYRNVSAQTFDAAAKKLVENGYHTVRVGKDSAPWHLTGQGMTDYASAPKEPWMDLCLFERCKFFCGSTSGIYSLADLFRKPIIFTNFAPLGQVYSWSPRHLTIFKKLRDTQTGELVPASELLNSDLGWMIHWEKVPQGRYAYEDNSSGEIAAVVDEMMQRLEGTWQEDPEDIKLQEKFWSRIRVSEYHCHKNSRIGAEFLRSNADWLLA